VNALSPNLATLIADALLVLHVGIVAFVVLGTLLILAGGWRGWRWVRNLAFRIVHLGLVLFIALQAWLGRLCPLTVWEQALRNRGGQATYGESFMQHWLSQVIFYEAPWWSFVAAYTLFFALVLAAWWWIRPRRGMR
jgi:hypothetical protein